MEALCKALTDAGVTNRTSQAGIDFCVSSCPYPRCVVDETTIQTRPNVLRRKSNQRRARGMFSKGKRVAEIAEILGVSVRTVKRYLGGK